MEQYMALKISSRKCKRMTTGRQTENTKITYTLNKGETIHHLENAVQEKDIGVIIDSNLEFDKYINTKINKANSMYSIIHLFNFSLLKMLSPYSGYTNH